MADPTPLCFRCNIPLTVRRVHPLTTGFEARTFRCTSCDHHMVLVAASCDPMDSSENRLTSR